MYLKNKDLKMALKYKDEMEREKVKPLLGVYCNLIKYYRDRGLKEEGIKVYQELKTKRVNVNVNVLYQVVDLFHDDINQAAKWYKTLTSKGATSSKNVRWLLLDIYKRTKKGTRIEQDTMNVLTNARYGA